MNKLEMVKEAALIIGSLQNNTVTGLNSDDKDSIVTNINREVRSLYDERPPWGNSQWDLRLKASIDLVGATTDVYTATGVTDVPQLIDSSTNLKKRDKFRLVTDGTNYYRVTDVSGITYTLDTGLVECATTDTKWTAYKDVYPLPANCGDIDKMYYESGERDISLAESREDFSHSYERRTTDSEPLYATVGDFSDRYEHPTNPYKYQETSVTATNNVSRLTVSDSTAYEYGDVLQVVEGTTDNYIYTVIGIDASNNYVYLDHEYSGGTGGVTVNVNPIPHTEYLSFSTLPTDDKQIIISGWMKPYDMVSDDDECAIPEDLCPAVIIGSLLRDKWYREFVSEQWSVHYKKVMNQVRSKKNARVMTGAPNGWRNRGRDFRESDINWSSVR